MVSSGVRASAPSSFAEAEPGPSPRAGTGGNGQGGRARRSPFSPRRTRQPRSRSLVPAFSLSAFLTAALPHPARPRPCCSMRSSRANQDAPGRAPRALIGRGAASASRHFPSPPPPQLRVAGRRGGNRHFGERPPRKTTKNLPSFWWCWWSGRKGKEMPFYYYFSPSAPSCLLSSSLV